MKTKCLLSTAMIIVSLLIGEITVAANTWQQWRGPQRDGTLTSFKSPSTWPERLKLKWKVEVGTGHSSPILSGNRVYMFTRQDGNEVISSYDLKSGKQLWRYSYPADYVVVKAGEAHGKWPRATPLLHDNRLYTLGISGAITCVDARTGKLVWKTEATENDKTSYPVFGFSSSPLFIDGSVIVATGGQKDSGLTAFNPATGEVKWNWRGEYSSTDQGLGYSSPVLLKQGEDTHLVMLTDAGLIGLSTQSGSPLWKFPIKLAWGSAMTPAIISDQVIISDKDLGLVSVRVSRQGNEWVAKQVWEKREFFAYMSSPVVKDGMVYGLSHRNRGQYFCVDLQTGQMLWQSEGRQGEMAVVRVGNNEFFVQTEDGELIVARKSREKFDIVRRYQIAESATWAEPVLFDGYVLIKDANSLTLWSVS